MVEIHSVKMADPGLAHAVDPATALRRIGRRRPRVHKDAIAAVPLHILAEVSELGGSHQNIHLAVLAVELLHGHGPLRRLVAGPNHDRSKPEVLQGQLGEPLRKRLFAEENTLVTLLFADMVKQVHDKD